MMIADTALFESVTQFGMAGLMGTLWLWERLYSRRREQELTQAHQQLLAQQQELQTLVGLVQRNTAAIERFDQTQLRLAESIDRLAEGRRTA